MLYACVNLALLSFVVLAKVSNFVYQCPHMSTSSTVVEAMLTSRATFVITTGTRSQENLGWGWVVLGACKERFVSFQPWIASVK